MLRYHLELTPSLYKMSLSSHHTLVSESASERNFSSNQFRDRFSASSGFSERIFLFSHQLVEIYAPVRNLASSDGPVRAAALGTGKQKYRQFGSVGDACVEDHHQLCVSGTFLVRIILDLFLEAILWEAVCGGVWRPPRNSHLFRVV